MARVNRLKVFSCIYKMYSSTANLQDPMGFNVKVKSLRRLITSSVIKSLWKGMYVLTDVKIHFIDSYIVAQVV